MQFMIDLEINMLRCFVEVAQTGSFTLAGKNIGLTQSGVSVKIRRLEERLDTRIFNRTSKQLTLTMEGERLLDEAGRILGVHDEAVGRLMKPKASGRLRVGLIDYFLPERLPAILGKFRRHYPNIHLEVHTNAGSHLVPLFEKGELDLVVTGQDDYHGPSRILTQEPLVWVMGKNTDPSMLQEPINLLLLPASCSFRQLAVEGLNRINRKWEVLFTGSSIASIQAAVQAGMGVSVLPQGALKEGMKKAPAHLNLPELPLFSIVMLTDPTQSNPARDLFISYLEDEVCTI